MVIHETREEILEILAALREAKLSIIRGESRSYTIGSRQVEFLRLEEIDDQIKAYEAKLDALDGTATLRGARSVVPLDL